MAKNSLRPWQGTALGVCNIIGTVFLFLSGLVFVAFQGMLTSFLATNSSQMGGETGAIALLAGMGVVLGVILLGLGVLYLFVTMGVFKGQKWAVIFSLIFAALGVLGSLTSFQIFGLVINGFVLYVAIMCYKDPFYGGGK